MRETFETTKEYANQKCETQVLLSVIKERGTFLCFSGGEKMAKEVLERIKDAELENQKKMVEVQKEMNRLRFASEEKIAAAQQAQQDRLKEKMDEKKTELEAALQAQKETLFSSQSKADDHFKGLYNQNKDQALQFILKKVRENYGS